jgi:hypothetical protein
MEDCTDLRHAEEREARASRVSKHAPLYLQVKFFSSLTSPEPL